MDVFRAFAAKGEANFRVQDLLYAARSLGVPSMWAYGRKVMRRKSWDNGEAPYLPSTNHGIYRMLPFCRIKHVYRVAGQVQLFEFKPFFRVAFSSHILLGGLRRLPRLPLRQVDQSGL